MTNQEGVHIAIRTQHAQRKGYGSDWSALFDQDAIPQGDWNGRLINWINFKLTTTYTEYSEATNAFAISQGFQNWGAMNTIVFA